MSRKKDSQTLRVEPGGMIEVTPDGFVIIMTAQERLSLLITAKVRLEDRGISIADWVTEGLASYVAKLEAAVEAKKGV